MQTNWTEAEMARLTSQLVAGIAAEQIASETGRSYAAVRGMKGRIERRALKNGRRVAWPSKNDVLLAAPSNAWPVESNPPQGSDNQPQVAGGEPPNAFKQWGVGNESWQGMGCQAGAAREKSQPLPRTSVSEGAGLETNREFQVPPGERVDKEPQASHLRVSACIEPSNGPSNSSKKRCPAAKKWTPDSPERGDIR